MLGHQTHTIVDGKNGVQESAADSKPGILAIGRALGCGSFFPIVVGSCCRSWLPACAFGLARGVVSGTGGCISRSRRGRGNRGRGPASLRGCPWSGLLVSDVPQRHGAALPRASQWHGNKSERYHDAGADSGPPRRLYLRLAAGIIGTLTFCQLARGATFCLCSFFVAKRRESISPVDMDICLRALNAPWFLLALFGYCVSVRLIVDGDCSVPGY